MTVNEYTINVGAENPFSVYHMSDNHICLADTRDNERKRILAKNRTIDFAGEEGSKLPDICDAMLSEVRAAKAPLIHTGDMIDFVSYANLDYVKDKLSGQDVIMAVGNHEFSQYVGEAFEDEAYKSQSKERVLSVLPQGCLFGSRVIEGVKFITLDNVYYYVLPEHLSLLQKELAEGLPTVLVVHTPLYSSDTYRQVVNIHREGEPPYLCGCPEPYLRKLEEMRYKQQVPDETTLAFLRVCEEAENLKAVLAGHLHFPLVSRLDSGIPQYAVGPGYSGYMNKYTFV